MYSRSKATPILLNQLSSRERRGAPEIVRIISRA